MQYNKTVTLKNGEQCLLRNGDKSDAAEVLRTFRLTHTESDYLLTYPDEDDFTLEKEEKFLDASTASDNAIEICAVLNGKVVGTAGFSPVGGKEKIRHRAEFGIAIEKAHWGKGLGKALTAACIECAKSAGYRQLELDVVADNTSAVALYKKMGFTEYGRNPRGFLSRISGWQELVLMRLEF